MSDSSVAADSSGVSTFAVSDGEESWPEVRETTRMRSRPDSTEILHEHSAASVPSEPIESEHGPHRRVHVVRAWRDDTGRAPAARLMELQRWEGVVQEVLDDSFTAVLHDRTSQDPDQYAELPVEEISEADRPLLTPGAVFYWWIGYRDGVGGRTRASVIRLRRLPGLADEEIAEARAEAQRLREALGWSDQG